MPVVTREQLQKILDLDKFKDTRSTFPTIDELLDGDLDLEPVNVNGLKITVTKNWVGIIGKPAMRIMHDLGTMSDEDHMKYYSENGLFHDGGDDFDYGGSFVYCLWELLNEYFKQNPAILEEEKQNDKKD